MKNIIFFGDSFAAHGKNVNSDLQTQSNDSYIDIVADTMQATPIYMGFGGVSWWYSYRRLLEWIRTNPRDWRDTEALVMCLTAGTRPKLSTHEQVNRIASLFEDHTLFYDEEFDRWSCGKFLKDIAVRAQGKKVLLMPCFQYETWAAKELKNHFSTCVTNLHVISRSELSIVKKEQALNHFTKVDPRSNHMNKHNNQALAQEIIHRLQNYKTGMWSLTAEHFQMKNKLFLDEWADAEKRLLGPRQQPQDKL